MTLLLSSEISRKLSSVTSEMTLSAAKAGASAGIASRASFKMSRTALLSSLAGAKISQCRKPDGDTTDRTSPASAR
jgi:hypothetical protein